MGKKFKHKNTCNVHIRVNHLGWTKRKLFECPECFRSFDNKKGLDAHRDAAHLGIRTVCPLCEKPVTRLDLHVRMVHTDLPEWPCPDCGKKFKGKFDINRHKNAVHYGMKIKWNSRKYKEKAGKLKPRKQKEETLSYRKKHEPKLEETTVETWVEMEETTTGEEIITMESHEGQSVILQDENGDIIQAPHFKVVEGDNGESQIFVQADNDGQVQFLVMAEGEAQEMMGTEHVIEVQS